MNPTPTPLTRYSISITPAQDSVVTVTESLTKGDFVKYTDVAALERRNAELRDAEKKSRELAGQLVAFIKVNALSGKFRHAIYSEVEAALHPFIERLTAQQALAAQEGGEG